MSKIKFTPLQIIVHASAWLVLAWILWGLYFDNLSINPIQTATQRTGKTALIFLVLSLACTPLNTFFGFRPAQKVRRALGLFAFMFAAVHFLIFSWVDFAFDLQLLKIEFTQKRFVFVGIAAFTILAALAFTSYKFWMKKLGKNWKRLHRLVYFAAGLVILHYAWAKKGDIFRLQGDILGPLSFGVVILVLLVSRIPAVRRLATQARGHLSRRLSTAS